MVTDILQVDCVHCGHYELSKEQLLDVSLRGVQRGYQCYRCDEEVFIKINGKVARMEEVQALAKEKLGYGPERSFANRPRIVAIGGGEAHQGERAHRQSGRESNG